MKKTLGFFAVLMTIASGSAQAAIAKPAKDRAATIYSKCVAIEKLDRHKSAVRCLDKFLDRLDVEVGSLETAVVSCRDTRKFENLARRDLIETMVNNRLAKLRLEQRRAVIDDVNEVTKNTGLPIGPRKQREIDLRRGEAYREKVSHLAKQVCNRATFGKILASALAQSR